MFGLKKDKSQIEDLLREIRAEYETYIIKFKKTQRIKQEFEYRYRDAVEYRMDLLRFLNAEREALAALVAKAEAKNQPEKTVKNEKSPNRTAVNDRESLSDISDDSGKTEKSAEKIKSYADRMIEEFAARIDKYPEIIIHSDASNEMKKLFGALSCIEKDYWSLVDRILRNQNGSRRFWESVDIEPEINRLCRPGLEGIPSALTTYYRLLERLPRDYNEIEREEKRSLLAAASLLKKLQDEVIRAIDGGKGLDKDAKELLSEARVYIDGMMDDFRLKDLARLT